MGLDALLIGGGSLLSGLLGSSSMTKAASTQADASAAAAKITADAYDRATQASLQGTQESLRLQLAAYLQSRADLAAQRAAGQAAMAKLLGYDNPSQIFPQSTPNYLAAAFPGGASAPAQVVPQAATNPGPVYTAPAANTMPVPAGMSTNQGGIESGQALAPQSAFTDKRTGQPVYNRGGMAVTANGAQAHGDFEDGGRVRAGVNLPLFPGTGTQAAPTPRYVESGLADGTGDAGVDPADPTGAGRAPVYNAATDAPGHFAPDPNGGDEGGMVWVPNTPGLIDKGVNTLTQFLGGTVNNGLNYAAGKFPDAVTTNAGNISYGGSDTGGSGSGSAGAGPVLDARRNADGSYTVPSAASAADSPYNTLAAMAAEDRSGDANFAPQGEFFTPRTFTPDAEFIQERAFYPGEEFTKPVSISAADLEADPSYQFRKDEAQKAAQRAASAAGYSASGRELKAAEGVASNLASTEYANVYARAANDLARRYGVAAATYDTETNDLARRYGISLDQFNAGNADVTNRFNRLASIAGVGQAANTNLSSAALNVGGNAASTYAAQGSQIANIAQNQGNTLAQITQQAGADKAGATLGQASLLSNSVNGGISNYLAYRQNQDFTNAIRKA